MANHEINEEQEAVNKALRMIETSDPVHADVYNALFSVLINNDVFLEKLANKMVQQVMISHVMDSTNPDMVMGADQGPVITKLIEKVREQVDVLNTNLQNAVKTNSTAWLSRVELKDGIPLIDFHFNNSPEDYTSRIIEDLSGSLNIVSDLRINDRYPVTSENSRIRFRNQGGFLMGRIDDLDLGGVVTISGHCLKFVWDAGTKRIYVWMDSTNLGYLNILS